MRREPLGILVTGDPVRQTRERVGGFANLVRAGLAGVWEHGFTEVDVRDAALLPPAQRFSGLIVTGSPSSVTERAPWMRRVEEYLADVVKHEHPVLGICFGHQLLGQALGGLVERNPRGRELGTVPFSIVAEDPLLDPRVQPALAHTAHVDSVTRLPPGARVLATTEREPHAAVRFGERAWGVQFHPEFDEQVMRDYLESGVEGQEGAGLGGRPLLPAASEARAGRLVLRRFIEHGVRPR